MPNGAWSTAAAGTYTISIGANEVADLVGNFVVAQTIGTFTTAFSGSEAQTGSISGTVFDDTNGDGIYDGRDLPMVSTQYDPVIVSLVNQSEAFTDDNGDYSFTGLSPGVYTVTETAPIGYDVSTPSTDSYSISLSAGQTVTNINFADEVPQVIFSGSPQPPATQAPPTPPAPTPPVATTPSVELIGPYIPAGWVSKAPPPVVVTPAPKKPTPAPTPKPAPITKPVTILPVVKSPLTPQPKSL